MGIQDRDYARERKLDYTSKYDRPKLPRFAETNNHNSQDLPKWIWPVCGVMVFLIYWMATHWK